MSVVIGHGRIDETAALGWRRDTWTVVAIAGVAYALSNLLHEGLGHGLATLAVGGEPKILSAILFESDLEAVSSSGKRWIAAGGSIANVLVGALAWLAFARATASTWRLFWWVLTFVNLMQASGYLLFSGLMNIGDWAAVVSRWQPAWVFRMTLTTVGAVSYLWVGHACARELATLVGGRDGVEREGRGWQIAFPVYATGGVLYCLAGAVNPIDPGLILTSAAAASLGGTSGFMWCPSLLQRSTFDRNAPGTSVERHRGWIIAGVLIAIVFVAFFGPGVAL